MTDFAQSALQRFLMAPPKGSGAAYSFPAAAIPLPPKSRRSTDAGSSPEKKESRSSEDDLRIVKAKPAGDVLHIFSHIRKTYRVQWVLLVGGRGGRGANAGSSVQGSLSEEGSGSGDPPRTPSTSLLPPTLRTSSSPSSPSSPRPYDIADGNRRPTKGTTRSKQAARSTQRKKSDGVPVPTQMSGVPTSRQEAMWVKMEDVPNAKCVLSPS